MGILRRIVDKKVLKEVRGHKILLLEKEIPPKRRRGCVFGFYKYIVKK